jgi:hypothetical protein
MESCAVASAALHRVPHLIANNKNDPPSAKAKKPRVIGHRFSSKDEFCYRSILASGWVFDELRLLFVDASETPCCMQDSQLPIPNPHREFLHLGPSMLNNARRKLWRDDGVSH